MADREVRVSQSAQESEPGELWELLLHLQVKGQGSVQRQRLHERPLHAPGGGPTVQNTEASHRFSSKQIR